jgi:SAM-dependent methyltransferase
MPRPEDWREVLIVAAATRRGLMTALARDGRPDAAADALGLDRRATRVTAAALAELGYLAGAEGAEAPASGRYGLTERGRALLGPQPDGSDPAGDALLSARMIAHHLRLADVLESGAAVDSLEAGGGAGQHERFVRAMRHVARPRAPEVVAALPPPRPGARLLDAGGAPGTYALALAAAGWAVTVLDLPEPLAVTGAELEAAGVATVAGDMTERLPPGPWDAVYMGNVTHLFPPGAVAALLARAGAALAPGGALAVQDFVRGRSPRAARFAVSMLLATDGGDTYGLEDYRRWLAAAGCPLERAVEIAGGEHLLLVGRRA